MKPKILNKTIAALLLAVPLAHAEDKKGEEGNDGSKSGKRSSASSVVTSSDGTATITIDINGKKETRTFKLGDGSNMYTFGTDADGATASGSVGYGGAIGSKAAPAKARKGPWIGIAMEPVEEVVRAQLSLAPGEGIVVSHVVPDSPAARAGLTANDILLRFDDQIIVEPGQLQKLTAMKKPGDSVKLTCLRKGERKEMNVTLIEHELAPEESRPMRLFQYPPGLQGGQYKQPYGDWQEQLKQWKQKHPGIIVDKWSWSTGPDGAVPWNRERFKDVLDEMRKHLENSKLPKDEQEKIRKNIEEAMENARKAVENATKDVNRWRKDYRKDDESKPEDKKPDDAPKKSAEPL